MAHVFTCPHGHQWEDPFGASLAGKTVACPVCGADTEVIPDDPADPSHSLGKPTGWPSDLPTPSPNLAPTLVTKEERNLEDLAPISAVPGYTVLCELGRGGMGVVYKARQEGLKRTVALKMILAGAHASSDTLTRFKVEAEAVARLQHPNIVQVYEIGEHEGRPYFSMEFVDGGDLVDQIYQHPLGAKQAARMIAVLARAMHATHQQGIVHRDLKPANVLLTKDGTPKITDFGLAKNLGEPASKTRTGDVMGTPSYMAPEQAEGRVKDIGPGTDVYALGAILYEILTARPPFKAETMMDTLLQVLYDEPLPPGRLLATVPRDLETICLKCLSKEIGKRYPTALDLALDLDRFLEGQPIQARPVPHWERAWKWARRRPAAAALLAVGILAPLIVLGVSLDYNVELNRLNQELDKAARGERQKAEEAETQRADAVLQKGLANRRRDEAEGLRKIAEHQRRRAEQNFRKAREAVKLLLTEVAQNELANVRLMEDVRQRLLARAVAFHKEFLEQQSADPSVRQDAGQSLVQLGDIYQLLGKYQEADDSYAQALVRFRELIGQFPDEPDYRCDLAVAQLHHGQLCRVRGQLSEAEADCRAAIKALEQLTDKIPKKREYRSDLAFTMNELARVLHLAKRPDDAERQYNQAIAIQEALVKEAGDAHPEYRENLAGSLNDLGKMLRSAGKRGKAEEAYRAALDQFRQLSERYPQVASYKHKLAAATNNLGNVLGDLQGPNQAAEPIRQALALRAQLVKDFPSVLAYRQELADTHNNLAALLAADKRYADAQKECLEAQVIRKKLAEDYPEVPDIQAGYAALLDNAAGLCMTMGQLDRARELLAEARRYHDKLSPDQPAYRQFLRKHYVTLADTLLRLAEKGDPGKHAEVARAVAELPKLNPDSAEEYRLAAVALSRCFVLVGKDRKLMDAEQKKLGESYAVQAVQMLRQAVQKGYGDLVQLKTGKDFAPLRSRADFQQLVAELEQKK
jgi:serine/threonine protein kinase/tetratricopeptide (TPR) repeat protein